MCIGAPSLALIADILAYFSFSTLSSVVAAANAGSFYFSLPFSLEVSHVCFLCVCAYVRVHPLRKPSVKHHVETTGQPTAHTSWPIHFAVIKVNFPPQHRPP